MSRAAGSRSPGSRATGGPSSRAGSSATPRSSTSPGSTAAPPPAELERTDFIEADIRSAVLSRLLPATEVDTVVHCGILWYPEPGRPARALHEINVIGTLQLLAACERTETLRAVVVRGSAAIYGCEGAAPSFFTEDMARARAAADALSARHLRARGVLRQLRPPPPRAAPAACCATSPRSAPGLDSPLVRYLTLPVVPVQLGFDPRLQLLHADDATGALEAAVAQPGPRRRSTSPRRARSRSAAPCGCCGRPARPGAARRCSGR